MRLAGAGCTGRESSDVQQVGLQKQPDRVWLGDESRPSSLETDQGGRTRKLKSSVCHSLARKPNLRHADHSNGVGNVKSSQGTYTW